MQGLARGDSLSLGCDSKVSTLGFYSSTPNSTFPKLCTPGHTKTHNKRSSHRQPLLPAEPCLCPAGNFVVLILPSSFRLALEDHFFPFTTSSPFPLPPLAGGHSPNRSALRSQSPSSGSRRRPRRMDLEGRSRSDPTPGDQGSLPSVPPALAPKEVPPPLA